MWPGVAVGAQGLWSRGWMALRSPLVQLVMVSCSAKLPVWASLVRVQVGVLAPKPVSDQQSGAPLASASTSIPGFGARFSRRSRSSKLAVPLLASESPMLIAVVPAGVGGGDQVVYVQPAAAGVKALLFQNVQAPVALRV